jgi:hypothetical protein
VYRYTRDDNPLSNVGTSVLAACRSDLPSHANQADGQDVVDGDSEEEVRRKVEGQIRKHSHDFEWFDDESVSVTHRVPGEFYISRHVERGRVYLTICSH